MAALSENWLAKIRASKLSTRVGVLFVGALIIPWCAYAWLAATERAGEVKKTEQYLTSLAAGYGEHATTLMRLGIAVPTDETAASPGVAAATSQGADEIGAFRGALNMPAVTFSLRAIAQPGSRADRNEGPDSTPDLTPKFDAANGIITAAVNRPASGIAAIASMGKDQALQEWQTRADTGAIALLLRSLFVAGVGLVCGEAAAPAGGDGNRTQGRQGSSQIPPATPNPNFSPI